MFQRIRESSTDPHTLLVTRSELWHGLELGQVLERRIVGCDSQSCRALQDMKKYHVLFVSGGLHFSGDNGAAGSTHEVTNI
jgi:hypothetical protein